MFRENTYRSYLSIFYKNRSHIRLRQWENSLSRHQKRTHLLEKKQVLGIHLSTERLACVSFILGGTGHREAMWSFSDLVSIVVYHEERVHPCLQGVGVKCFQSSQSICQSFIHMLRQKNLYSFYASCSSQSRFAPPPFRLLPQSFTLFYPFTSFHLSTRSLSLSFCFSSSLLSHSAFFVLSPFHPLSFPSLLFPTLPTLFASFKMSPVLL